VLTDIRAFADYFMIVLPNINNHLLKSPHLIKKDDSGVPTILCSINRCYFYNTVCDTRLGVNIMAKVTYEFQYGTMPMDPTYAQLQLAG